MTRPSARVEHAPSAHADAEPWFAAMRRGDFQAAWKISDAVQRAHIAAGHDWTQPRHQQWIWDGRELTDRTVLVRCYHGLGDTIMFARFLPWLCQRARRVIVWAQPALLPLLATLQDVELELLPLHDGSVDVAFDVDVEIMELAHAMRVERDALPAPARFAVPPFGDGSMSLNWAGSVVGPRPRGRAAIGVMALSGPYDPRRSVPPHALAAALSGLDADVFNFALDAALPLAGAHAASTPDILELAARLQMMDLVISADTMLVHLAGSLRLPTWIVLNCDADWRWGDASRDALRDGWCGSCWYPTVRLYPQRRRGDWRDALRDVRRDALRLAGSGTARAACAR